MIKTLLITGIVTTILAVLVLAFLVNNVVFENQDNEQIREFLNSTGTVEKFKNSAANKTNKNENRSSPLVQQAEDFANYLNPPKHKLSKNGKINKDFTFKPTPVVKPKFPVLGTIVCPDNPILSQVLIDEPGKGRHWVRQSDKVGHLFIEHIEDGLVIVKGGEETFKILIEKTVKDTSLSKKGLPASSTKTKNIKNSSKLNLLNLKKKKLQSRGKPDEDQIEDDKLTKPEERSTEEQARLEELVNNLKEELDSNDPNSDAADNEKAEKMEKFISRYKSSRVSTEEAKMLGYLGEKLKSVHKNTNQSLPIIKKLKTGTLKSKLSKKL